MPDAVTTQMDERWAAITKAFADGQEGHELYKIIPSAIEDSDQSVRLSSLTWIADDTGMLRADTGSLVVAHMWRERLTLDLDEWEDGQTARVRLFSREWADHLQGAILETLKTSGHEVVEAPTLEGMSRVPLSGPRPYRALCGKDVYPLVPPKGDANFESPRHTLAVRDGQALIFSPGRFGPWLERLQGKPELSWMPSGEHAILTASLRFYLHGTSKCVLYGEP
jgi:hypothetical protein